MRGGRSDYSPNYSNVENKSEEKESGFYSELAATLATNDDDLQNSIMDKILEVDDKKENGADRKLQKGNGWRYPGVPGPTYCLTSCSPVVTSLVYQPRGPGFDSWHMLFRVSYDKGKPQMMLLLFV